MKVKNGIASSVSLFMMPKTRSGSAWQEVGLEQAELDADEAEEQAVGGQRERHRIAEQQEDDQAAEHDRRHVVDQERLHLRPPGPAACRPSPWP